MRSKTAVFKKEDCTVIISHYTGKKVLAGLRFSNYNNLSSQKKEASIIARQRQEQCKLFKLPFVGGQIVVNGNKKKATKWLKEIIPENFFTGPDLGCKKSDLNYLSKHCNVLDSKNFNEEWTAKTTIDCLKIAGQKIFDEPSICRRTVAIQGLGKCGMKIAEALVKDYVNLIVTDLDIKKCRRIKKFRKHANVKIVKPEEIYSVKCDFFIPCSVSNVVNKKTVNKFKCKAIVGPAYNQCSVKPKQLHIPEILINSGGMLALAEEAMHGKINKKKLQEKINDIPGLVEKYLN